MRGFTSRLNGGVSMFHFRFPNIHSVVSFEAYTIDDRVETRNLKFPLCFTNLPITTPYNTQTLNQ